MCGLAGRFAAAGLREARGWHQRAGALLAHRGPDGAGHYADAHCELVHRRLALIDLSPTGHQPMGNEDGRILVVFNGEIYNHRALRESLRARGHDFRGTADTEVLVHLYEEYGERLVEHLRGIFAFALYDRRTTRLVLARDRFGVKPLFYAVHDGQLVFASEIKAILALPGFAPPVDRQACGDFLALGYVPEPATGFAGVRALPRGSILTASAAGERVAAWDELRARPDPALRLPATVEAARDALLGAVEAQSYADVPVAALLSGGIDSALVVAAHRHAFGGSTTTTFTAGFPDPRHDESPAARAVAAHCGTRHHAVRLEARALTTDTILGLLRHFDQPFADTSCIPTWWVAAAIRERGIVCALAGDGGDEVFGGYPRFWRAARIARLMALPDWCGRAARRAGTALAGRTRNWGRQLAKAAALAHAGRQDSSALLAGLATYLDEGQQAELLEGSAREALAPVRRLFDGYRPAATRDVEELSRRLTETEFAVSLPSDMLRKVDMMSMRAGIEVRVPMLDERLVALGLRLPHRLKTDGRRGKLVLRSLARRWLPREVVRLPKHGFTIPLDVMVPDDFHDALGDLLAGADARTRPVFNGALVRSWLDGFRRARAGGGGGAISRAGLYQRVMMLLSLELWLRDHGLVW